MANARILIVKDPSKTTIQIKNRLSRLGYKVTGIVSTLPSIFKNIEKKEPDLLLLDPAIRNEDPARQIAREIQAAFDLPVVLLGGDSDPFDCVPKPYRSAELHTAIELALYKHNHKKQDQAAKSQSIPGLWEEPSQKSEELFSKAFHANPSGMIISSLGDGRILDANRSYERLLGYTVEELRASSGFELGVYNDPADREQIVTRLQRDGFVRDLEGTLRTKSGQLKWVLFSLELIEIGGQPCILSSMFDISERKQAEETLQARERFLGLLNDMTKTVLLSRDVEVTLNALAIDMARLLDADDCYITRWDSDLHTVIPTASTAVLGRPFSEFEFGPGESNMTFSVLQAGHALAAEDAWNSPFINRRMLEEIPVRSMLGVPLIAAGHKLGAVLITFKELHHFTAEEIGRAEQAGNQIALALWNFQQSSEIEQRLKESSALAEIGRALSKTERVGTGQVLQLIVDSARDLIPQAEKSVIHLLDAEQNLLIAEAVSGYKNMAWNAERVKMRLGEGVAGRVIHEGVTINVRDVNDHPDFLVKVSSPPEFRSLLVAPVQSGGRQIGTISVQSQNTHAFSKKEEELLNALGVQAAIAIENTHLFESIQLHLKEMDALYRTSQRLAASLNADELIEDVTALLKDIFSYYHAQIFLLDPSSHDLILKKASGKVGEQLLQSEFRLGRGTGIVGHVAETGEPFVTNDVNQVVFFYRNPLLPDTQSELTVPIKVEGNVVGVLDVQDAPPHRLTESDLQLMVAVADQLAVALQKAHLHSDLQTALQQEQNVRSQLIQSERLALVGRLLASVSHELNNPLQAIQNALFLLKDETSLSGQAKQDLDIILSETERMAALIERLRSAYRPVRMTDFQPVSLNLLIEDVYMLMSTHMRHREIVFEFLPEAELAPVSGISDQLRQVVLNLFLNAVEVMKPGGRLTVQTQSLPGETEVLLTVKDSGPGVDPEILPRIFEPFITTKHTGTGLGLTITHDIVEQHHGRILAENHPDGGAIFSVWLATHERQKA